MATPKGKNERGWKKTPEKKLSQAKNDWSQPFEYIWELTDIDDMVQKVKNISFADEKLRKSWMRETSIVLLEPDGSELMANVHITDAKNLDPTIEDKVVRQMKVIAVWKPSIDASELIRFLWPK